MKRNNRLLALLLALALSLCVSQGALAATAEAIAKAEQIVATYLTEDMNDYQKALTLHDWLTANANYDYTYREYYEEGVLLKGTGVCQSYAYAYKLLLDKAQIKSSYDYGNNHIWNQVYLGGKWYNVDATWDDPGTGGGENHEFFGLSDAAIRLASAHEGDPDTVNICNGYEYNYEYQQGTLDNYIADAHGYAASAIKGGSFSFSYAPSASLGSNMYYINDDGTTLAVNDIRRQTALLALQDKTYSYNGEQIRMKIALSGENTLNYSVGLRLRGVSASARNVPVGESVVWTADTSGLGAVQYCFYVYKDGALLQKNAYQSASTFSYTPLDGGAYTVKVYARNACGRVSLSGGSVNAYYDPLVLSSVTADRSAADAGDTVTWTASATGGVGEYTFGFRVYKDGVEVKRFAYNAANARSYVCAEAGEYTVKAFVKDASGTAKSLSGGKVTVTAPLKLASVKVDQTTAALGASVTWTSAASGGTGSYRYCFYIYKDGVLIKKGSYSTANTCTYVCSEAGEYSVKAHVRDATNTLKSLSGGKVTVTAPLALTSVKVSQSTADAGDTVTWTASASGGVGEYTFGFRVYKDGVEVKRFAYNAANARSYVCAEAGEYTVRALVKDASGTAKSLSGGKVTVTAPLKLASVKVDQTTAALGASVTWTSAASGGTGSYRYCFYIYKDGVLIKKGSYSTANTCTYVCSEAGEYSVKAYVRDAANTLKSLSGGKVTVTAPLALTSVKVSQSSADAGDTVTWTASASGGVGEYTFGFRVYKDGVEVKRFAYNAANARSYVCAEAGEYTVRALVKDASGTAKSLSGGKATVAAPAPLAVTSVTANIATAAAGDTITWTASASGGVGEYTFGFRVYKDGVEVKRFAYNAANARSYVCAEAGEYTVRALVKDASGTAKSLSGGKVIVE